MTTPKNPDPGYRLPSGDLTQDDLACMILFYPDRDEYRRALWGSLDFLGTWLAWERDTEKRGAIAAKLWKNANDLTQECYAMNTCDTILQLLTQIEKNTRTCCGESTYVTYNENLEVITVINPGVGSPPAYYGETAVTGWDDWAQYVCYHAHKYVDDLIDTANKLHVAVSAGGYVLDFIAHLFSLIQWRMVEDIIPVNFSVIQAIFNALGEGLIDNEFDDLAQDFETNREDIVCAIMLGDDLGALIESIVPGYLWTIYYSWFDYDTTVAVIYEGGIEGVGYLTPAQRADCLCEEPPFELTGYHWEPVALDYFFYTTNVTRVSDSFDAENSIASMAALQSSSSGARHEFGVRFADIGGQPCFYYGCYFKLVACNYTGGFQDKMLYSHKPQLYVNQARLELTQVGVNTAQIASGAIQTEINENFDYNISWSDNFTDRIRLEEWPDGSASPSTVYSWSIQVYALRPN